MKIIKEIYKDSWTTYRITIRLPKKTINIYFPLGFEVHTFKLRK